MSGQGFTTITVKLTKNVMNPRGHLNGLIGSESYYLAHKGEEVRFTYKLGQDNTDSDLKRVVDLIMCKNKFPIAYRTRREAWTQDFVIVSKEDWFDDEYNGD